MNDAEAKPDDAGSDDPSPDAPNPEDFDPNSEVYWTLPMVLAWIVYRDSGEVRQMWDQYRSRCMDDAGTATVSLHHIACLVDDEGHSIAMSPAEAERLLLGTLAVGSIAACGIPLDGERRVEIKEREWADFGFFEGHGSRDEVRAGPFGHGYHSVLLKSRAVRQAWPAIQPPVPFSYEIDELERLPLFQAVIWCATGGADTTNLDIQERALQEQGEKILFLLLSRGVVTATGECPSDLLREDIPKEYWERASSDIADEAHFVDYTRDGLAPFGERRLRWQDIKTDLEQLQSVVNSRVETTRSRLEDKAVKEEMRVASFSGAKGRDEFHRIVRESQAQGANGSDHPKRDDVVDHLAHVTGCSKTWARELWAREAPQEWRKPGPRGSTDWCTAIALVITR
ncbi:hypothetical protein VQ045_17685 [Aurantimonas sp. E1-2-R+4]|uniref:hypothetical protein n=1 Tax=Aurantimonas sp. E1-2-R+4 TaxID=3113714 RepID=UPI002F935426